MAKTFHFYKTQYLQAQLNKVCLYIDIYISIHLSIHIYIYIILKASDTKLTVSLFKGDKIKYALKTVPKEKTSDKVLHVKQGFRHVREKIHLKHNVIFKMNVKNTGKSLGTQDCEHDRTINKEKPVPLCTYTVHTQHQRCSKQISVTLRPYKIFPSQMTIWTRL